MTNVLTCHFKLFACEIVITVITNNLPALLLLNRKNYIYTVVSFGFTLIALPKYLF